MLCFHVFRASAYTARKSSTFSVTVKELVTEQLPFSIYLFASISRTGDGILCDIAQNTVPSHSRQTAGSSSLIFKWKSGKTDTGMVS